MRVVASRPVKHLNFMIFRYAAALVALAPFWFAACRQTPAVPSHHVLVAARELKVGEVITGDLVRDELVPITFDSAGAVAPAELDSILGATVAVAVPAGRPMQRYWVARLPTTPK